MIYVLRNHLWHIFRHDCNISGAYYRTFYWQLADIIRDKPWRWRYMRDHHWNTFLHDRDLVSIGSYLISHHMKINWYNKTAANYFVHTVQMVFDWLRLTGSGHLWHQLTSESCSFEKRSMTQIDHDDFDLTWSSLQNFDRPWSEKTQCRHLTKRYQK